MLDNNTYNILAQLTEEHQSLWRIKKSYKTDAEGDEESKKMWEGMEDQKEENIGRLEEMLKQRIT